MVTIYVRYHIKMGTVLCINHNTIHLYYIVIKHGLDINLV